LKGRLNNSAVAQKNTPPERGVFNSNDRQVVRSFAGLVTGQ